MRSHSYLNSSKQIIESYDGRLPFAIWLKSFFKTNKKFGGRDRKEIGNLCFGYYRIGKALQQVTFEDRILAALFLSTNLPSVCLKEQKPEWAEKINCSLDQKIGILPFSMAIMDIFPWNDALSDQINKNEFNRSFLNLPDLFLRLRPGSRAVVFDLLNKQDLGYVVESENCIRLANGSKLNEELNIDKEFVVQDLNSQQVLKGLDTIFDASEKFSVWDCCAASGGKSILACDQFPNIHLSVSDIRKSILINLRNRFKRAGISDYRMFVANISDPGFKIAEKFDLIICDVPCSGSGTWARTPEQLTFFTKEKITDYARLQKSIFSNACRHLKSGGAILYITCSVFKEENEDVVAYILENLPVKLLEMKYYKGYDKKADTLFTALFKVSEPL